MDRSSAARSARLRKSDDTDVYSAVVEAWQWPTCSDVILSFRVSRGCDLRRLVVDSVLDGTAAA
jgi:hypothetical protein